MYIPLPNTPLMYKPFVSGWNKIFSPTTIYGSGLLFYIHGFGLQKERRISFQKNFLKCKSWWECLWKIRWKVLQLLSLQQQGSYWQFMVGHIRQSTDLVVLHKQETGRIFSKTFGLYFGFEQKDEKGEYIWKSFSTVTNARRTFKNTSGWRPRNNGEKYSPISTLTAGLVWSQNIATASLLESIGGPEFLIDLQNGFALTPKIGRMNSVLHWDSK